MLEIPYFHMVSSTFQKFGKTMYTLLSNLWNGQISKPFQIGNEWKCIIGNIHKAIEM